jgi:hypothetical protein
MAKLRIGWLSILAVPGQPTKTDGKDIFSCVCATLCSVCLLWLSHQRLMAGAAAVADALVMHLVADARSVLGIGRPN